MTTKKFQKKLLKWVERRWANIPLPPTALFIAFALGFVLLPTFSVKKKGQPLLKRRRFEGEEDKKKSHGLLAP